MNRSELVFVQSGAHAALLVSIMHRRCYRLRSAMAERARQRMASAPAYPDHPDDLAEQEAVTRAFAARQARAQSEF